MRGVERLVRTACVVAIAIVPSQLRAQVGERLIVGAEFAPSQDEAEELGVADRPRPEFEAVGVRFGSFVLRPRVQLSAGATSNAYLTAADPVSAAVLSAQAAADLTSNWSRHYLAVRGRGQLTRYVDEAQRNEDAWYASALGRLDIRDRLYVGGNISAERGNERRFAGTSSPANFAVSPFRRDVAGAQAVYAGAFSRVQLSADITDLRFAALQLRDGSIVDQSARDRTVKRLTLDGSLSTTPSFGFYGQVAVRRTDFDDPIRTLVQGDSKGWRVLAGVTLNMPGIATGTIGAGYSRTRYDTSVRRSVSGLSLESRVQLYPQRATTVTVQARRALSDADPVTGPFWETAGDVQVDQEIRYNILLRASAIYARQRFIGVGRRASGYGGAGEMRFLLGRHLTVTGRLSYNARQPDVSRAVADFSEVRSSVAFQFQL